MTTAAAQLLALAGASSGQAGALLAGAQPGGVGQQNIFLSQSVITTRHAESYTASIQSSSQTLSVERARQIFTADQATTAETWAAEESTSVFRKTPEAYAMSADGSSFARTSDKQLFVVTSQ